MNYLRKIILLALLIIITGCSYANKRKVEVNNISKDKELLSDKDVKSSIFKNGYRKAQQIVSEMSVDEKIGQLFLARYNLEEVLEYSNYHPGGYVLFAKDFENHTAEEMKEEIANNQKNSKYPMIMAVDEEGESVTRVSRFASYRKERFKSPKAYYDEGGYPLLENMEAEKATMLKNLGINLNLAPVADVSVNSEDFIYNRAFGYDAVKTSEFIKNMVSYAKKNNIGSCLKHFPGYGNNVDTHTGIAIDNRSYEEISNNDYLPFKAGIAEGVPCILVSHNIVKAIDENYPSSLSPKVVNELRDKLEYSGIIITDDLAMDAVRSYVDDKAAATLAINAGCDMIITSDFLSMFNELKTSVKEGRISIDTLNKAVLRIISWKQDSNLF